jgi:hypothetical protein
MSEVLTEGMVRQEFERLRQPPGNLERVVSEARASLAGTGGDKYYVHHNTCVALLSAGGRVICVSRQQRLAEIEYCSIIFVHVCSSTDVCFERAVSASVGLAL